MPKTNADNERIKRRYLIYLRDARGLSEASVDAAAAAIDRFQASTGHADFKRFTPDQARGFKRHLAETRHPKTGAPPSAATVYSTLVALRNFVRWLADQPGYKSRITYSEARYLSPLGSDARIAKGRHERTAPTMEQLRHLISTMPAGTEIERRDRAIVAFIALTGARDGAVASFRLKHVDIRSGVIHQDAREVRTKRNKTFSTWFFPVGDDVHAIVEDWVRHLIEVKLWGPDDPLFPATLSGHGEGLRFQAVGLDRRHWAGADPIRAIFRTACARAGLPYYNPHSVRTTLVRLAQERCRTPEEFKAWSQNLGHEEVLTTFNSYGTVAAARQAEIIGSLCDRVGAADPLDLVADRVISRLTARRATIHS